MSGDAGDLCRKCGLCCDGSLFHFTPVAPDEVLPAALAAHVVPDEASFPQPCPCFDGECTVYADRPRRCIRYRCLLLTDFDKGRISRSDAETMIAEVRALQGRIYEKADVYHLSFRADVNRILKAYHDDPARAMEHTDVLLDIAAYDMLCRRFATEGELRKGVPGKGEDDPAASS